MNVTLIQQVLLIVMCLVLAFVAIYHDRTKYFWAIRKLISETSPKLSAYKGTPSFVWKNASLEALFIMGSSPEFHFGVQVDRETMISCVVVFADSRKHKENTWRVVCDMHTPSWYVDESSISWLSWFFVKRLYAVASARARDAERQQWVPAQKASS